MKTSMIAAALIAMTIFLCTPLFVESSKASAPAVPYKLKIFARQVHTQEAFNKLESDINAWLKNNWNKIEIYSANQSNSSRFVTQIGVWYREQATDSRYQAKIFMDALDLQPRLDGLEKLVNAWMRENDKRMDVVCFSQGSSDLLRMDLTVWYRLKN